MLGNGATNVSLQAKITIVGMAICCCWTCRTIRGDTTNAAHSEGTAATSKELAGQADQFLAVVAELRAVVRS